MSIKHFFHATHKEQYALFPSFKRNIEDIVKSALWREFYRNDDRQIVEDCSAYIIEYLISNYDNVREDTERTFIYEIAKRYLQKLIFRHYRRTVFIEDYLNSMDSQNRDKVNPLKRIVSTEQYNADDYENLKQEVVQRFQELLMQNQNDRLSIVVLCALIECIDAERDYNSQYLSLFVYRKTCLSFNTIKKRLKKLNLTLRFTRKNWFDKIFDDYSQIEVDGIDESSRLTISDWEKRAIFHFENSNDRFKSKNYDQRYNRISDKRMKGIKSTRSEREGWIRMYEGNDLEGAYYKRFGTGYSTFLRDKSAALN